MAETPVKKQRRLRPWVKYAGALLLIYLIYLLVSRCWPHAEATPEPSQPAQQVVQLNDTLTNAMSQSTALEPMEREIEKHLSRWEIKGAQLAVTRHDSLLFCKGFGWADEERGEAMTPGHIMRIASVSKLLTAVGVMKLQEMGRLKLSDKVFGPDGILNDQQFTDAIRDKRYFQITVEHLLRHQGGFTNRMGDPMFSTRYIMMREHLTTPPTNEQLLRIFLKYGLAFTPGTSQRYSNFGYMILSLIMQRCAGMPYEQFMRQQVLAPAGCHDFHIAGNYYEDRRPNEVRYYMHDTAEPIDEFNNSGRKVVKCYGENDIPRLQGAGAWCASAAELSRFIAAIDGMPGIPDILSATSIEAMTREMPNHAFSLGWNFTPSRQPWNRTGTLSGTSALVLVYPDGECWIILTNTSTWKGQGFAKDNTAFFNRLRNRYSHLFPARDLFL